MSNFIEFIGMLNLCYHRKYQNRGRFLK